MEAVKVETGEYSTAEENKPIMMYANKIKNLKKKNLQRLVSVLTVAAGMNSDSADAAKYLSQATGMNFPDIMRLTAKGIIITVNSLKSKYSCGYDEITT
jgi:hypothetical protein